MTESAVRVKRGTVCRCLSCRKSTVGAIRLWQNRDTFYVDCNELARIPAGTCPLFEPAEVEE